jgi:DNA-binding transcriptional LysR family regulator
MNYTLHQLQVFLEVVRHQSITRAAEELFMTQPALSIQLKNFQNQFDIPLTEVVGRQLYVTDFGQAIAELAENVIKEADAIKYKTKEYGGLFSGKLRISTASTGKYVIPYFLSAFAQKHSGVDLLLDVANKIKAISSLKNNEIDFALVSVVPDEISVYEKILIENRLLSCWQIAQVQKKPAIHISGRWISHQIGHGQIPQIGQAKKKNRADVK